MTIVLCAKGYPNKKITSRRLKLNSVCLSKSSFIFHAGTIMKNGLIFSNGGRVLNIVVLGNVFLKIRSQIFKIIRTINWKHGFFRRDIGWRIIKKKWEL